MPRAKFPRIKTPPKVPRPKTAGPCVHCGKGLGTCRGGWCQRCVTEHIEATTPNLDNISQANEMLGRKALSGTAIRGLDPPNHGG